MTNTTTTVPPLLLSREAAGECLATSPRRIDELRRSGLLLATRDGQQFKYRPCDLAAYVENLPTSLGGE